MPGERLHDRRATLEGAAGALLAAAGLSATAAGRATAADQQDDGGGTCDLRVPDDYDSIQAAVDDADGNDTVCVAAGTYEESVTVDVAGLTLRSEEPRGATIDASGAYAGVYVDADGVTLEGLEITGDDDTNSGVSVRTGNGATEDITIANNHIHGMAKPGGDGVFDVSSWGILAWGDETLRGVLVEDNLIEGIGGARDELPAGAGIDLEDVEGSSPGEGAVVRRNTIADIADADVEVSEFIDLNIEIGGVTDVRVELPGTGIAIQPTDGERSGAEDPATDIRGNDITGTSVDVVLGEAGLMRVMDNE